MRGVAAPTMIDLGDVDRTDASRPRAYPPWLWRRLVIVALVPLSALGLAGSRPTPSGEWRPLWSAGSGSRDFTIGADTVYVVRPGATVTARNTATGQVRWTLPVEDSNVTIVEAGPSVAIHRYSAETPRTRLVDAAGTVTATIPGYPVGLTRSGRHLLVSAPDAECPDTYGQCGVVSAWDVVTRRPGWSIRAQRLAIAVGSGARIDQVATVDAGGTIFVRDPDNADVTGRFTPRPAGIAAHPEAQVTFVGADLAVVAPDGDRVLRVTLYRSRPAGSPYAAAWSLPLRLPDEYPLEAGYALVPCGGSFCLRLYRVGTRLIDPDRGLIRTGVAYQVVGRLGGGTLVATSSWSEIEFACAGCQDVVLVDPVTGATRARFPGHMPVRWEDGGGRALLGARGSLGRTGFTVLDPDGRARPVGIIDGIPTECGARAAILVCYVGGQVHAWRLPV